MRWPWQKKGAQFEDVLRRLIAAQMGNLDGFVGPDNCMQSPTMHAIVTAVSRRMAVTPVRVIRKGVDSNGRETKEHLPRHSVSRLLARPNAWQSPYDFWQDATSTFLRYGAFYAHKSRRSAGAILGLLPLESGSMSPHQDEDFNVTYRYGGPNGRTYEYQPGELLVARGMARNFVKGDSTVNDISTSIALEILAERFGANFFKNGALPLQVFEYMEGSAGFRTPEQEQQFIADLAEAFGGDKMLSSMLLPKGIKKGADVSIDFERLQMIDSRKYQRTVIAGAYGVPPHLVGDLERGTFNNVEQQDKDFTSNVVMPVAKAFESAMERDLLTVADRIDGVCIRFNLDATLRADFKSRQEGLRIQRDAGVISPNEWRELEGKNPLEDDEGGNDYIRPANMVVAGEDEETNEIESDDTPGNQEFE